MAMRDYEELVKSLRICADSADPISECCFSDCCEHDEPIDPLCMGQLIHMAADAIEELQKALDVVNDAHNEGYDVGYWAGRRDYEPKWISVEERLPERGQEVLCACRAGIYEVFKYVDGISGPWYKDSRHVYMKGFVTHWMPLPEPPKEDADA